MAGTERAPGFKKYPGYRIQFEPIEAPVEVWAGDSRLASSRSALKLFESKHRAVVYVPLADVDAGCIEATETETYCPFKGQASYWTLHAGGEVLPDAMWGYLNPYAECAALEGYCAFYTDRVTIRIDGVDEDHIGPGWTE